MSNGDSFRALAALHGDYKPVLYKRAPRFTPERQPPCWQDVRVPAFDWTHPDAAHSDHLRTLDVNGAFLAPLSGTEWAHNPLQRTRPETYSGRPGFYLVETVDWWDDTLPSPLGSGDLAHPGRRQWLAHPTVALLQELVVLGLVPRLVIHDAWTCTDKVRPVAWANYLRDARATALLTGDKPYYQAIKRSYGQAVVMMISGKIGKGGENPINSPIHRPDWGRAVQAQHAANTWRKLLRAVKAGAQPLRFTGTDEVMFDRDDLLKLQAGPNPLKLDESALQLGAFKTKASDDLVDGQHIHWERP